METIIGALISTAGVIIAAWIQGYYSSKNNRNSNNSSSTNQPESQQHQPQIHSSESNQVSSNSGRIRILTRVLAAVIGLVWQFIFIGLLRYIVSNRFYRNETLSALITLSNLAWFIGWFIPCINLASGTRKLSFNLGIIGNLIATFALLTSRGYNVASLTIPFIFFTWIVLFIIYFLYKFSSKRNPNEV